MKLRFIKFFFIVFTLSFLFINTSVCQKPIKIGVNYWTGSVMIYLAESNGYFISEGINVSIIWYNNYEDGITAFKNGEIDMFQVDLASAASLIINGKKFVTPFCPVDNFGFDEIVSKGLNINQLKGKKIALFNGTISHFLFLKAIAKENLDTSDFDILNRNFVDSKNLFINDEVDAIGTHYFIRPPNCTSVYSTLDENINIPDFLVIDYDFSKKRREDINKFLVIWDKTVNNFRKIDYEKSKVFIQNKLKINDSTFFESLNSKAPVIDLKENSKKYFNQEKTINNIFSNIIAFYIGTITLNDQQKLNYEYYKNNVDSFIDYTFIENYFEKTSSTDVKTGISEDTIWGIIGIVFTLLVIVFTAFFSFLKQKRFKKMLKKANELLKDYLEGKETTNKLIELKITVSSLLERHILKETQYHVLLAKISEIQDIIDSKLNIHDTLKSEIDKILADGVINEKEYHHLISLFKRNIRST